MWKDIKGFNYAVSTEGIIINKKNRKEKAQCINSRGYLVVNLWKNNKQFTFSVHRLMAEAFIPNPNNYPEVNHKDENKLNNFVWVNEDGTVDLDKSNLEWCTPEYNLNYGTRIERIKQCNTKIIIQETKQHSFIKEWESAALIEKELGYNQKVIRSCCSGHKPSAYGYIWKYKETD